MPSSSPDWSKCPSEAINGADLPPSWSDTSVLQCGFIYPSEQPLDAFGDCCLNEPAVQNGCFNYCQTDNSGIFGGCVLMNINLNGSLQVSCNSQATATNSAGWATKGEQRNWKARLAVASLAAFAFL